MTMLLDKIVGYVYLGNTSPVTVYSLVASLFAPFMSVSLSTKSRIGMFFWTAFTLSTFYLITFFSMTALLI